MVNIYSSGQNWTVEIFRTVGTTKLVWYLDVPVTSTWCYRYRVSCQTKFWNNFARPVVDIKQNLTSVTNFTEHLHIPLSWLTLRIQKVLVSKRRGMAFGKLTRSVRTNLLIMDFSVCFQWTDSFPFVLWMPSLVSWPWTVSWAFCRW